MRVGSFSLLIPEARERDSGHVEIAHGQVFTLRLSNHGYKRCDAEVSIDGKPVGGWRLNGQSTITLERPADDTGRFTFFKSDSVEADKVAAGAIAHCDRGLIQIVFKPEKQREREIKTCGGGLRSFAPTSSGITGLTGQSQQQFHTVNKLDYEPSEEVTISLRLVCCDINEPRVLKPQGFQANPVPNPV